jgi:RNA polymerase sigma-70 factor, ECF subfamily
MPEGTASLAGKIAPALPGTDQAAMGAGGDDAQGSRSGPGCTAGCGATRGARKGGARDPRSSGLAPACSSRAADELVDRLRRGDDGAIESLVTRYGAWVHRVARRILRDPRDAGGDAGRPVDGAPKDRHLQGRRRLLELALSHRRQRRLSAASPPRLPSGGLPRALLPVFDEAGRLPQSTADWSAQLDDPVVDAEVRKALDDAIARLPDSYRVVFVLRDVEGVSIERVAQLLGLSVGAVKTRLHRARLALRHQLAELLAPVG